MKLHVLLAVLLVFCLSSPIFAQSERNKFEVEFKVYRGSENEDPKRESERTLLGAFKKAFGNALEKGNFSFQIKEATPPKPSSVVITIEAASDLRGPFKAAIKAMQEAKTKCDSHLVRQTMEIATTSSNVKEGEETLDYSDWEERWNKSMRELQQQLRGTIDRRMDNVLKGYEGQPLPRRRNWSNGNPEWYGFGPPNGTGEANKGQKGEVKENNYEDPPKVPRPPRYAWTWPSLTNKTEGTLRLLVDTEKKKVVRLLAHDVALGLVLTRLSAQVSITFVIESPKLAQQPVCLSLSDCTVEETLNRLAHAAGGKVKKRGFTLFIEER